MILNLSRERLLRVQSVGKRIERERQRMNQRNGQVEPKHRRLDLESPVVKVNEIAVMVHRPDIHFGAIGRKGRVFRRNNARRRQYVSGYRPDGVDRERTVLTVTRHSGGCARIDE